MLLTSGLGSKQLCQLGHSAYDHFHESIVPSWLSQYNVAHDDQFSYVHKDIL